VTAPQLPVPPGDPAQLQSAAESLDKVAAGLAGDRELLSTHGERLGRAWTSDQAAPAALAEAGRLGDGVIAAEKAARGAAGAVRGFAAALAQAQQNARGLQRRAASIEEQVRVELARAPAQQVLDEAALAYRPLQAQHQQMLADLDQVARRTRQTLESLAPDQPTGTIGGLAATPAVAAAPATRGFALAASYPRPPHQPAAPMKPPGDCTQQQHDAYQAQVHRVCDQPRRCSINQDLAEIEKRAEINQQCIAARSRINNACYRGGDAAHQPPLADAVKTLINCQQVLNEKRKQLGLQPNATPRQSYSQEFLRKMEQLTGLTGAALIIYLIISEGSRIFPPRNAIPVP
jgi:hypothetical protein